MNCIKCKAHCSWVGKEKSEHGKCLVGYVPMTNADRIRAMTDVELAMWMAVESWNYPPCTALTDMEDGTKECVQPDCTGCWLDWLEQECET